MADKRFNPEHAAKLLDPKRKELLPTDLFIQMLQLQETDHVADLGAGNGFFTIPFAKKTNGTVYAIDIEPSMLDALKERVGDEGINNIEYLISNLESINMPASSVEKIFCSFVMHEVPNREKAISEMKRILKPHGMAVILDWKKVDEVTMGPPNAHRLQSEDLANEFKNVGFDVSITYPNELNFALVLNLGEKES